MESFFWFLVILVSSAFLLAMLRELWLAFRERRRINRLRKTVSMAGRNSELAYELAVRAKRLQRILRSQKEK
jgi:hypothetical protein